MIRNERSRHLVNSFDWILALSIVVIASSSLFRGGNRGVALAWLEICGLVLLTLLAWKQIDASGSPHPGSSHRLSIAQWLILLSPLWISAFQILFAGEPMPVALAVAALSCIPPAALAWAALSCNANESKWLLHSWTWVAVAQASFGLLQLTGANSLFFGLNTVEPVIGTFASKNTYANLLVMAIPLAVLQFMEAFADRRDRSHKALWGWGTVVFVLVVTVMLTTSRTGIATGLLVLLLSVGLLRPEGGEGGRTGGLWWWVGFASLIVVVLLSGGLEWAARFDADRLSNDADFRALMRSATAQGALAHLPLGTGLGSYPWVASEIQPPETGRYWMDLAHNDYAQLLMETGVLGAGLLVLVFSLYLRAWWQLLRTPRKPGESWPRQQKAALACGIGLLAFALHAWVDYPFHIPANAMMAATLFGLMLRERSDGQPVKSRFRRVSAPFRGYEK
jgi:O-antigen ligase